MLRHFPVGFSSPSTPIKLLLLNSSGTYCASTTLVGMIELRPTGNALVHRLWAERGKHTEHLLQLSQVHQSRAHELLTSCLWV